jgi:PhnB protein
MSDDWKPPNMPTLIPALPGGRRLCEFVSKAFEVKGIHAYEMEGGAIARAEIRIGESVLMTGDPVGDKTTPPGTMIIYVPVCDHAYQRALEAGAKSIEAPADQFYGDRTARIVDPFGNQWTIATHLEDVSAGEMSRRMGG